MLIGETQFSWISALSPIAASAGVLIAGVFLGVLSRKTKIILMSVVFLLSISSAAMLYAKYQSMTPVIASVLERAVSDPTLNTTTTSTPILAQPYQSIIGYSVLGIMLIVAILTIRAVIKDKNYLYYFLGLIIPQLLFSLLVALQLKLYNLSVHDMLIHVHNADQLGMSFIMNSLIIFELILSISAPIYIYWILRAFKIYDKIPSNLKC